MHWVCGTAPEPGSCLWSPSSLLEGCASAGTLCPSHTAWASLGICLPQSFWLYLHSASGIGRKWGWGRPSAAQKILLFPRIIWGLSGNVDFGSVLEEKGNKRIIWASWFGKDSQIADCWSTYFTSMNFCGKLAWEWSDFKGNWCVDWLMLQCLPRKCSCFTAQSSAL